FRIKSIPGAMPQAWMRARLWHYAGRTDAPRSRISPRREFGRAFPVHNRARDRNIRKFLKIRGAAQHQSAATHVTATDKVRRKSQPLAKVCQQHVDVFAGGDAAEKNHFALVR